MTTFITVGPKNARTDPGSGLRFYSWQGRELMSVTSVRRMAGLPFGLHQWQISQVIDYVIDNAPELFARLGSGQAEQVEIVRTSIRAAATAERDRAAALGTAVHDAAAEGRALTDVEPEVRGRLRQFHAWIRASHAEIVAAEFQVFNLSLGYAGSVDALVRMPRDGSIWLVDYKTGGGIFSDYALQVVAYVQAEFAGADDVIDERITDLLGRVSGIALLHLSDDGWEFRAIRYDEETWAAFRGLLAFSIWASTHTTADSFTLGKREGRDGQ